MSSCPNILLIITDHWRGDCLGRFDHPVVETPHLDSLSASGITFTNAYSPCPSCIPARRSLMTGMTPGKHGMVGYQDGLPWKYEHVMAGELAHASYQTINVGKTHFHPDRLHLGFEELIIPLDYDEWIDRETGLHRARMAHGVHANSWMARPSHLPETQQEETWLTDQAMDRIIKRDPERPFFLCLSFNGPHPPWCPPQYYFDYYREKDIPPPIVGDWAKQIADDATYPMNVNAWRGRLSDQQNHIARAGYYAYLTYIDAQIGRLMEFLGRVGLARDTFTLFTSDHGEMLGDHHLWRKTYPYDASARVPFIVAPPQDWKVDRNVESPELVGLEDIMPTFLDVADATIPDSVEGRSAIPALKANAEYASREYYHHEHSSCYNDDCAYQCLTSKEWKYIWNPINGTEQLFDRKNDIQDSCDLSSKPEFREILAHWRSNMIEKLEGRPEGFSDGKVLSPKAYSAYRT